MFSTLPQSAREEGWEGWEAQRMQREDFDAIKHETSDSEMNCLSVADSPITRRRKLDTNELTQDQLNHLRSIKRKAQKAAHNAHSRGKSKNKHLDNLLDDISAALSRQQTRGPNGRFGQLD